MTLAGIKSTRNELETIRAMFPRPPELSPEQQAWMDSLSDVEIIALAGRIMGIKTDPGYSCRRSRRPPETVDTVDLP